MALTIASTRRFLLDAEKRQLADALGDSPETALPVHSLRKGHGQVYLAGELPDFQAVVIEDYDVGSELMAYGTNIQALWQILSEMQEWDAVNVPGAIAHELAALMQQHMQVPVRVVDDIYQVPAGPIAIVPNPDVRLLTFADIDMLADTPEDIRLGFEDDLHCVFEEELVAAAVVDRRIVATGSTYGLCEKFVDVAVSTLEEFRCRGYARAAASLVAAGTQQLGNVPIWSCAPTNTGSLQVASRLGFREVSRRANIFVDTPQSAS
jgi:RimJ/RimL family protein N-acetyltransferase